MSFSYGPNPFTRVESLTKQIITDITKQQNTLIKAQLNDLVSRGLLVVELGEPTLINLLDPDSNSVLVDYAQTVTLVLKDKEYIEKLEKENQELKKKLGEITETIKYLEKLNKEINNVK